MGPEELNENNVIQLLIEHLEDEGWTILQALTAHQPGIDLVAKRNGVTLYVEAKGATNTATGLPLADPYGSVCNVLMQTSALRHLDDKAEVALAVPDTPEYRYHIATIQRVLDASRIQAFLVGGPSKIRGLRDVKSEEIAWALKSLPSFDDAAQSVSLKPSKSSEIRRLYGEGLTRSQIAQRLGISYQFVNNVIRNSEMQLQLSQK